MRKLLALLLVLVLGALGLWLFIGREGPEPILVDGSHVAEKSGQASSGSAQLEKQSADSAREAARTAASAPNTTKPAPSPTDAHLAELKGRCLLPNGSAAAGASIQVHGWEANDERVIRHGVPENWENPETTTDADGRFSIRFDPPLAYQFVLNARAPGYAKASWRWSEIQPDEVKDLGDIQFLRGGSITGHIVAANGKVQKDGWTVHAESAVGGQALLRGGGRDTTRGSAPVDAQTGEFKIEDMPPGTTKLTAYSELANWIDGPTVEVRSGEVIAADIRYEGPDNSTRIVVDTFTRPFHPYSDKVQEILLRGQGIEPRRAAKVARSSQSFSFDSLPPGRYSVEINDPKFLAWSKDGIALGTTVQAQLKGNAAVRLDIVDAQTRQPVVASTVRVRFDKVNFSPNEFLILERGKKAPAGGLFDGLIPVDQTITVSAEGYADCEVPVPDLKANEVRSLRASMTHGTRIAGRVVVGPARAPGANVDVELEDSHARGNAINISSDLQQANRVRTDANGRFAFSMVSPGKHTVRASYSALLSTAVEVDVSDGADKLGLELALPSCSYLVGRLIAPEGATFEGLSLFAGPPEADAREPGRQASPFLKEKVATSIAADGSFRAGPLALGEAQVSLLLAGVMIPAGFHSAFGSAAVSVDLGRVTIVAGAENLHDFDVRSIFPGRIAITLRVNGSPAPGPVIEVRADDGRIEGAAISGADGKSSTNPLSCKSYRLLVRAVDNAWHYSVPQTVSVKPGETASVSVDVPLVEGVLQLLDDNGMAARVVKKVAIWLEGENPPQSSASMQASTDSDGVLHLKLPPGSYRLYSGEGTIKRDTSSVGFEMTASGPSPASVEFPK